MTKSAPPTAARPSWLVSTGTPRSAATISSVGPAIQSRLYFGVTTTAFTSQPRATSIEKATTEPGFEPRRITLGFAMSPFEERADGLDHPRLGLLGHHRMQWQREHLVPHPLG